jgi:hypothetical protein
MVVQGVKPFIEGLLALMAEISLATVRSFAVFMRTGMTTEPTFHRSCLRVDVSLLYLTHHDLMHYLSFIEEILVAENTVFFPSS